MRQVRKPGHESAALAAHGTVPKRLVSSWMTHRSEIDSLRCTRRDSEDGGAGEAANRSIRREETMKVRGHDAVSINRIFRLV
jgi:hypothetical protein